MQGAMAVPPASAARASAPQEFLRTRLSKIQAFALHLLDSPERVARMSEAELAFAQQLSVLTIRHMTDNILAFLPDRFQVHVAPERAFAAPRRGSRMACKRYTQLRPSPPRLHRRTSFRSGATRRAPARTTWCPARTWTATCSFRRWRTARWRRGWGTASACPVGI